MKKILMFSLMAVSGQLLAQPYYHAQVLELPGATLSDALAINQDGTVVGYSVTQDKGRRGFRFAECKMTEFKTFGGDDSMARGINDLGVVVGFAKDSNGLMRAFKYENGTMQDLTGPVFAHHSASAVNNAGVVVGKDLAGASNGVIFHPNQWAVLIPPFQADLVRDAVGVTEAGAIVATQLRSNGDNWGLMIVPAAQPGFYTTMRMEHVKANPLFRGIENSLDPAAANGQGGVTGRAGRVLTHAFRSDDYTQPAIDLGTLDLSDPLEISEGLGINRLGWVVGSSSNITTNTSRAFVHDGVQMIDLNKRLADPSGWELDRANGINDKGEIVGFGRYNGKRVGFLLKPTMFPQMPPKPCLVGNSGGF